MCGFAGVFARDRRPVPRAELLRMVRTMGHRGPDGEGYRIEPGLGLAFRRLAIIDVAGGGQPLCNEDRTIWLVCNGEIYNYKELVAKLTVRGHCFRTGSDSEVIVHAYEEWGEAAVEKLRGIFAFCVWDRRTRSLLLARDRSGVKPLYVRNVGHELHFASEAKALLVRPDIPRKLDLLGYTGIRDVDPLWERTAFDGVRLLGAGCVCRVSQEGEVVRRYWTYAPTTELAGADEGRIVRALRRRIARAVSEQMVSDVPIGAYLSGGIDSAAVVACMVAAQKDRFVRTYTTTSKTFGEDEAFARLCATHLGTDARFVPYESSSKTATLIPLVAWMAEGEFDSGYVSRYCAARVARDDGVKVILTGQGIDELLTGYHPSFADFLLESTRRILLTQWEPSYRGWPLFGERSLAELRELAAAGPDGAIASNAPGFASARFAADCLRRDHAALSNGLLRFEDRMGMAAGVEVRVPFLDHRVVELCASIPHGLRPQLLSAKAVLRRAARPWLPRAVVERPKFAFNAGLLPLTRLIELQHGSCDELRSLLSKEAIVDKGYFQFETVEALRAQKQYAALDHVLILQLLDELFVRRFDPARFAQTPVDIGSSAVVEPRGPRGRARTAPAHGPDTVGLDWIPALSPSVTHVHFGADVECGRPGVHLQRRALVTFAEPGRVPATLSFEAVALIAHVDGVRSLHEIARALEQHTALVDLLRLGQDLARVGVLVSARPSDRSAISTSRSLQIVQSRE